jgi:cbb3-type cytochrome oxidase subunit 3
MNCIFIIIIIILICILIYLFIYDNKKKEHFTEEKNIEVPINDAYLPDPLDDKNLNTDYKIISLYKYYLEREPTSDELKKSRYITEDDLKTHLLNSPEYNHMTSMQNNEATDNLEIALAKKDLFDKLNRIYKKELGKDINRKLVLPLKDCYIYLQFNDYLFMALLTHNKYGIFEENILNSSMITKKKLLELFDKYFDLLELKYKANDIIKYKRLNIFDRFENKEDKSSDEDDDNKNKIKFYNIKTNNKDEEKHGKNEDKKDDNFIEKQIDNIKDKIFDKDKIAKNLDKNKDTSVILRIYDPIDYNKTNKNDYRTPICNNLGIKNEPYPIIIGTDLALNATDLDKAFNTTQVGSIMPKFEYREYDDVVIK